MRQISITGDPFDTGHLPSLREESGEVQSPGQPIRRSRWSYLDHKRDPGGATMCGVTTKVYHAWRNARGLPPRDVRQIEDHEIRTIYRENYWDPVSGDLLPEWLAVPLMDFGLHSGPGTAIKHLQRCLGVPADCHLGAITRQAIDEADPERLVHDLMDARRAYCRSLKNYDAFRRNWEGRFDRIEKEALIRCGWAPHVVAETIEEPVDATFDLSGRAVSPPIESMAQSTTGNTAVTVGGTSVPQIGMAAGNALARATSVRMFVVHLLAEPLFWTGVMTLAGCAYIWLERRRHLREHHI